MNKKHLRGMLRVLAFCAGLGYWVTVIGAGVVLIISPFLWLTDVDRFWIDVPAQMAAIDGVESSWGRGSALFPLDRVSARLRVPIGHAPGWFFATWWLGIAVYAGLGALLFHHLRAMLRRLREGKPFDVENATRLRWIGVLLVAGSLEFAAVMHVLSLAAVDSLMNATIASAVPPIGMAINVVLMGLALIVLAEIFRHGAELEHDQSLVV